MTDKPRSPRAVSTGKSRKHQANQHALKIPAEIGVRERVRQPRSIRDLSRLELVPDELANATGDGDTVPPMPVPRKRFSFTVMLLVAAGGLVSLFAGLAIDRLVRELFERNSWLGWLGLTLAIILALAVVAIAIREIWCLARLATIAKLRDAGREAAEANDHAAARSVIRELAALYASRPDTAHGRKLLSNHAGEVIDGADLIRLAERDLLAPLDRTARSMVMDSAKRVAVVTAVSPRALVDIAYVLIENLRLIRRLSDLYGGRPGTIGFWRLARNVIVHLAATGMIATGDSLIQQFIGHGIAARLSAKLGEGVVNGLLTARIGIAAMDVCRPLPFIYQRRPAIAGFMGELTKFGGARPIDKSGSGTSIPTGESASDSSTGSD
jgi:putative membrane protein